MIHPVGKPDELLRGKKSLFKKAVAVGCAGLSADEAAERLRGYGQNVVEESKPPSALALAYGAVVQPFNGLMLVVAVLTACPPNSSYPTFVLIMVCPPPLLLLQWPLPARMCLNLTGSSSGSSSSSRLHLLKDFLTVLSLVCHGMYENCTFKR